MIRMYNVQVDNDGKVVLPEELRETLGGEKLRSVIFLERDGAVHLMPITMTFEEAGGSLPPLNRTTTIDLDDEIEEAMEIALLERYG